MEMLLVYLQKEVPESLMWYVLFSKSQWWTVHFPDEILATSS